jgi:hypothetical protein
MSFVRHIRLLGMFLIRILIAQEIEPPLKRNKGSKPLNAKLASAQRLWVIGN